MSFTPRFCLACGQPLRTGPVPHDDKPRPHCPACGYIYWADPKLAAGTIPRLADGRILLVRRAIEPERSPWVFPGGYVDRGEPVEVAAQRETREETSLEVQLDRLLGVYSFPGHPVVVIVYTARCPAGEVRPGPECLEARAFHAGEIPWQELAFPSTQAALRDYLALQG